jgi:hypothetical protein
VVLIKAAEAEAIKLMESFWFVLFAVVLMMKKLDVM